jgi:hypothetical protein
LTTRILSARLKRRTPDVWDAKISEAAQGEEPRAAIWLACVVWWDVCHMWTIRQRENWKNRYLDEYDSRTYGDLDESVLVRMLSKLGYKQKRHN